MIKTAEETERMRRGLEVYDTVIGVLQTYEADEYHEVRHGHLPLQDHYRIVVTLGTLDDGAAEALIKHHDFKIGREGADVVVYRNIH
jgi:hypothetical protein